MEQEDESGALPGVDDHGYVEASEVKRTFEYDEVHSYDVGTVRECLQVLKHRQSLSRGEIRRKRIELNKMRFELIGMQAKLDKLVDEKHHVDTVCEILTNLSMSNCDVSVCKTMESRKVAKLGETKENDVIDLMSSGNESDDDDDDGELFGSSDDDKKENGPPEIKCEDMFERYRCEARNRDIRPGLCYAVHAGLTSMHDDVLPLVD